MVEDIWVLDELDALWVEADGCGAPCISCEKSIFCWAGGGGGGGAFCISDEKSIACCCCG